VPVDCREIKLIMSDGYQCFGRYWHNDQPIGAVVYLHGIQSHGGWFVDSSRALCQCGFDVLLMDRRGSGRNEIARGDVSNMTRWLDDIDAAVRFLKEQSNYAKVNLVGVSWGGKLALGFYRYRPNLVGGLTLIAPGIFPQVDLSRSDKLTVLASAIIRSGRRFDIPLNQPELFTDNPQRQQFIADDRLRLMQVTARFLVCSRRLDWYVRALHDRPLAPLRLFLAGHERIIDNTATMEFYRGLRAFDKAVRYYPDTAHTLEFEADNKVFLQDLSGCVQEFTETQD